MKNFTSVAEEQFFKRIEEAKARELVISTINAAKEQVEYARALTTTKRAGILLGDLKAGQIYELEAETHFHKRNSQLKYMKRFFTRLLDDINENQKKHCIEFLERDGITRVTAYARKTAILRFLDSDVGPEEAKKVITQLDTTIKSLEELKTLEDINSFVQRHLDELIEKKYGNPTIASGLCLLILILSSMYALILAVVIIICVFTFGLACDKILDQFLDQICGAY